MILSPHQPQNLRSIIIALVQHLESTFRQCPTIDHIPYFSIQLCSTPRSLLLTYLLQECPDPVPVMEVVLKEGEAGAERSYSVGNIQRALSVTFGRNSASKQRITKPGLRVNLVDIPHDKVHNQAFYNAFNSANVANLVAVLGGSRKNLYVRQRELRNVNPLPPVQPMRCVGRWTEVTERDEIVIARESLPSLILRLRSGERRSQVLNEKHRALLMSRGVIVNDERYDASLYLKQSDKWWVVLFQAIRRRLRSKEASTEELAQVQKHFPSLVVSAVTQHFQHMARLRRETEPDIETFKCIRVLLGQDSVEHEFRECALGVGDAMTSARQPFLCSLN